MARKRSTDAPVALRPTTIGGWWAAVVIGVAVVLQALAASGQTARDVKGPTPLVTTRDEPPAKLIVDPPILEQLALGRVFIQYRIENLRILPVFGKAARSYLAGPGQGPVVPGSPPPALMVRYEVDALTR